MIADRTRDRRWRVPAEEVALRTSDGVLLHAVHLPQAARDLAFVIAHGMTNSSAAPATRAVIESFARFGGVIAADFRGHGRSAGRSSVGRDEIADVDTAVGFARELGYRRVVSVGFSMGGAIVLRYAGSPGEVSTAPDAVVAVSAPSRWYIRSSPSMRRVHWLLEHPLGSLVGRVAGIRLGSPWTSIPTTPLQAVGAIAPLPLLLVHGLQDHYFSPQEAVDLHRAAPGSELWLEPGMAHAETGITPGVTERIASWAEKVRAVPSSGPGTTTEAG